MIDVIGTYPIVQSLRPAKFRKAKNDTEEAFGYSAFQQWGPMSKLRGTFWPKPTCSAFLQCSQSFPPKPLKENSLLSPFLGLNFTI